MARHQLPRRARRLDGRGRRHGRRHEVGADGLVRDRREGRRDADLAGAAGEVAPRVRRGGRLAVLFRSATIGCRRYPMSRNDKVAVVETFLRCLASKDLAQLPIEPDLTVQSPLVARVGGAPAMKYLKRVADSVRTI